MALSIKDPELDRSVRRLARERNTTLTGAIKLAVDNELKRDAPKFDAKDLAERMARLDALRDRIKREGIDWSKTEDEILGYDEFGLPN